MCLQTQLVQVFAGVSRVAAYSSPVWCLQSSDLVFSRPSRVFATRPQDVQLQNAGAWGALASAPDTGAAAATEDGAAAPDAEAGGEAAPETDALWDEFQSREQQQQKRDEEKRAQEARLQEEKAKVGPNPSDFNLALRLNRAMSAAVESGRNTSRTVSSRFSVRSAHFDTGLCPGLCVTASMR